MKMRTPTLLLVLALSSLGSVGCKEEPTRWDHASSAAPPATIAPDAKAGGAFNKFFPADGIEGTSRVFTAEKAGYAEAKLKHDGKDLATISISDTENDPEAKHKFAAATDKLDGFPLVTVGKNQSALLVKDRYQVKVSSPTLDAEARKAWLGRFNINGLKAL